MEIKKLPYSNKYEKKSTIKLNNKRYQDYIGRKNKMEDRLLNKSEDISPSDFNEMGRVWTF